MEKSTSSVLSLPHRSAGSNSVDAGCEVDAPDLAARPLRIGQVELASPAVQAALSGYSDWPMRIISRRHGAAYAVDEVMIDQFVLDQRRSRARTRHVFRVTDEDHPVGGQLMGADPELFVPAALRLVEAGFDVIDINFGCPVKSAVGGCRGGYHLGHPETAIEIIGRVRDAVPSEIPVTVKLRRGIDDSAASRDQFFEIVDGAFSHGVAAIIVHGRTVEQKYKGPSRRDFLYEVKQHVGDRTVIGSGDLFSAEACLQMMHETGVDGVSIARGSIGNPWIFSQFESLRNGEPLPPPPTVREQGEVLNEHFSLALECYDERRCMRQMKKFGIKYSRLHPEQAAVRDAFVAAKTPTDWRSVIDRWYDDDRPGKIPQVDETQQ